jgi:hypothetical protein
MGKVGFYIATPNTRGRFLDAIKDTHGRRKRIVGSLRR